MKETILLLIGATLGYALGYYIAIRRAAHTFTHTLEWIKNYLEAFPQHSKLSIKELMERCIDDAKRKKKQPKK